MLRAGLRILWTASVLLLGAPAHAQEHFGSFLDQLRGVFDPAAQPRPTFQLEAPFRFQDPNGLLWATPSGTKVDGASIPQPLWSVIGGPFEGAYINASVIHDHYCRTKERTAHDTHRNFYYGMRAAGVEEWRSKLMHWAVATFGPNWRLEKRVVSTNACTLAAGGATCTSIPRLQEVLVTSPGIDLSDPDVLAAAVSKTNAVARTLLTTKGRVLDVASQGEVQATAANVQSSAETYRQLFATREFVAAPAKLGLLSQGQGAVNEVLPWANNRVPRLNEAMILTPRSAPAIRENTPFRLDDRSPQLLRDRVDVDGLRSTTRLQDRVQ